MRTKTVAIVSPIAHPIATLLHDGGRHSGALSSLDNHFENFQPVLDGDIAGVVRCDVVELLGDLHRLFEEVAEHPGTILRGGGGQGVTSRREIGGRAVFCKMYKPDRLHRRLRDKFVGLRCLREWHANCLVTEAGVATAPLVAAVAERHGLSTRHLVISDPAPGHPVAHWLDGRLGPIADPAAFLGSLVAFVIRLHAVGLCHPHLHAKHVFTADGREFTLIDLDRATLCQPLPFWRRRYNLTQMTRSLRRIGTPDDALLFEAEYWRACGLRSGIPSPLELLRQTAAMGRAAAGKLNPAWATRKVMHPASVRRERKPR